MDKHRYLITTADQRTWKYDQPVLFLSQRCCQYAYKEKWEKMDAVVAEPYGVSGEQKDQDILHIKSIFDQLLEELAKELNAFHKENNSTRYWSILLGPWLLNYITVAYNRYHTIQQAFAKYNIIGTSAFNTESYNLSTPDTLTFMYACSDNVWNNIFYSKVILFITDVELDVVDGLPENSKSFVKINNIHSSSSVKFKMSVINIIDKILSLLSRENDAFIINSYLPIYYEMKLYLSLGQLPKLWRRRQLSSYVLDYAERSKLKFNYNNRAGFDGFVRSILKEVIPTCYIEGYKNLIIQVNKLPWPSKPKFIFTSNNYYNDELFKAWTGAKIELGIPYYVGQHGNTHAYRGHPYWPELLNCDKFLTWGWSTNDKTIPAMVFKIVGRNASTINTKGGALLIEVHSGHWFGPNDSEYEYGLYQEEQFKFTDELPKHIQKELTVRLHSEHFNMSWSDEKRWKDRKPNIKVEVGLQPLKKLITESRVVVHSYDSTGILETLALNIPTVCFWRGGLDHLLPYAKPYYEMLRDADILADSPEHAAKIISLYWDDISEWWGSEKVQQARTIFCNKFAKIEKKPITTLKKLLKY